MAKTSKEAAARAVASKYAAMAKQPAFQRCVEDLKNVPGFLGFYDSMKELHDLVGCDDCGRGPADVGFPAPSAMPDPAVATNDPAMYGAADATGHPKTVKAEPPAAQARNPYPSPTLLGANWSVLAWVRRELDALGIQPIAFVHVLPLIVIDIAQHKEPMAIVQDVAAALGLATPGQPAVM